jgi:hypothetical protein
MWAGTLVTKLTATAFRLIATARISSVPTTKGCGRPCDVAVLIHDCRMINNNGAMRKFNTLKVRDAR